MLDDCEDPINSEPPTGSSFLGSAREERWRVVVRLRKRDGGRDSPLEAYSVLPACLPVLMHLWLLLKGSWKEQEQDKVGSVMTYAGQGCSGLCSPVVFRR